MPGIGLDAIECRFQAVRSPFLPVSPHPAAHPHRQPTVECRDCAEKGGNTPNGSGDHKLRDAFLGIRQPKA